MRATARLIVGGCSWRCGAGRQDVHCRLQILSNPISIDFLMPPPYFERLSMRWDP